MDRRVRLDGAPIRVDFPVVYGLSQDLVFKVHVISFEVDGRVYRVLVGEGDIPDDIKTSTLEFIGERIENILREDRSLVAVDGDGYFGKYGDRWNFKERGLIEFDKKLYKAFVQDELGRLMMRAYRGKKVEALEEVLEKALWFVSRSGMREFIAWKRVKQRGGSVDSVYKYLKDVLA
jgi:hypothetical protein